MILATHNSETTIKLRVEERKEECIQKRDESRRRKRDGSMKKKESRQKCTSVLFFALRPRRVFFFFCFSLHSLIDFSKRQKKNTRKKTQKLMLRPA